MVAVTDVLHEHRLGLVRAVAGHDRTLEPDEPHVAEIVIRRLGGP